MPHEGRKIPLYHGHGLWAVAAYLLGLGSMVGGAIFFNRSFDLQWQMHLSTCMAITVLSVGLLLICAWGQASIRR